MDNCGVRAILDYAVEEDISEEQAKNMEMHSCVSLDDVVQAGIKKVYFNILALWMWYKYGADMQNVLKICYTLCKLYI